MKEIKVKDIPPSVYFWRKGYKAKWLRTGDLIAVSHEFPHQVFDFDFKDEIVLTDPLICEVCWEDVPGYPPQIVCPYCGTYSEDRESLEKMRKKVAEWTGNPNPHI